MTIKKCYKSSNFFIIAYFLFWITETIFFIIRDGWHWKPLSNEEMICDNISFVLFFIAVCFFISAVHKIVKLFAIAEIKSVTYTNTPNNE